MKERLNMVRASGMRGLMFVVCILVLGWGAASPLLQQRQPTYPQSPYPQGDTYDSGYQKLSELERTGRDTWYFWTGGNQKFWKEMARITDGNVDLMTYVDSRRHNRRFKELGAITHPGCKAATQADQYGLWLDDCSQAEQVPQIPGVPIGIVGLRKFDNPSFDRSKWSLEAYLKDRKSVEPPYLIGMSCGFCHIGFNPLNPPADPEKATWANLFPTIGNQYFEEGKLFSLNMKPDDFRWHVANRQAPGTSDTSRFATDHINNPNAINTVFYLAYRPTHVEKMRDGSMRPVNHILKDGSDSVGVAGASLRVYVNIGMCSDYWLTLHDPVYGVRRGQQPFDMDYARANCQDWRETEARMPAAEAFLKTLTPLHLRDAAGGAIYLTADEAVLRRGKLAFADQCASCHSSKQPPEGTADKARWFRDAVLQNDFLENNFLSDDKRYPVTELGTNIARAAGTNAMRGHVWEQFSSETYKELPAVGTIRGLYNPSDPGEPIDFELKGGGRGYYRTPALTSIWATAPYLHNNALGTYIKDPSVSGRLTAFYDGIEKLLWPERRLGSQAIPVTTVDSYVYLSGTNRRIRIPAGTPVDWVARVDPNLLPGIIRNTPILNLISDRRIRNGMIRYNQAPDFILDRGHAYGTSLPDEDKWALIEFLKSF